MNADSENIWPSPERPRLAGETPAQYVRAFSADMDSAMGAYLAVVKEGEADTQLLLEAKSLLGELGRSNSVSLRNNAGHSKAMTEHWLRRSSDLSDPEIAELLTKHEWSEQ